MALEARESLLSQRAAFKVECDQIQAFLSPSLVTKITLNLVTLKAKNQINDAKTSSADEKPKEVLYIEKEPLTIMKPWNSNSSNNKVISTTASQPTAPPTSNLLVEEAQRRRSLQMKHEEKSSSSSAAPASWTLPKKEANKVDRE